MLTILIAILGIILTLFFVVGVHELGHFLVARAVGVKVMSFSIGFGKALYSWRDKKGTEYILAPIPLGGYVKMLDETEENVSPEESHRAFNRQPYYKKFAVVAAGPLANLLFAFVLYWLIFMIGFNTIKPVIGNVIPNGIAAEAGVKSRQEIIAIDQVPTQSWTGVLIRVLFHTGSTDSLEMQTTKERYVLNLAHFHLDNLKPDALKSLGLEPYFPENPALQKELIRHIQYGPVDALSHAWRNTKDFSELNLITLGKLLTGKVSLQSLGGPISIFQNAGAALNNGIIPFIGFLAFLSIAIGIINILPIPGLDGGHLLFQTIESIRRRPISIATQALCYRIGIIVLVLIVFQSIVNDLMRL